MASSGVGGGAHQREIKYRCVTPHQTFFNVQNMLFQFGIASEGLLKSATLLSEDPEGCESHKEKNWNNKINK
jgi:hypothetical protein